MSKAKFFMFHGKNPKKEKMQEFHVPENLILLGEAVAIEYRCSKKHGGGDGKRATYRHEFETKPILCMDEKCKQQLYILGDKIKITGAGIEH